MRRTARAFGALALCGLAGVALPPGKTARGAPPTVSSPLVASGDFSPAALDRFEAAKHHVRLPDGIDMAYLDIGPRDAPAVLLVHGYTDSARDWMPVLPDLSPQRRYIIPDLRGHGDSSKPDCCYALVDFAHDLVELTDVLHLPRVAIVGHSLGSMIAQVLVENWPDRVTRAVLISSTGGLSPAPTAQEKAARAQAFDFHGPIARLHDPIDPDSPFMKAWWGSPGAVNDAFIARQRADSAKIPASVWRAILDQGLTGFDPQPGLKSFHAPALLVWGEKDPIMIPEVRQTLIAALPAAQVAFFAGDGHNPFWEEPRAVATRLNDFLLSD